MVGLFEVLERNKDAFTEITHSKLDIPVEVKKGEWFSNKSRSIFGGEFIFNNVANLVGES